MRKKSINKYLDNLEKHLSEENPVLLDATKGFRAIDEIASEVGLLNEGESTASQIPWWPLISILGTFSAGKSTFINHYLGVKSQRTGNQAVDEKFSVLSFSKTDEMRTLPGIALDADPRFPFYQISKEIDEVADGEGQRINAYLQLKTCPSDRLRGKILIDSPGFDADSQRTSTLRITRHIINISDLVLVLFDARHPEPGAMQDTLHHLVEETIQRSDSEKFLYILNQIDTTAREDNPEDVVAAWQRALAEKGLTAGRFYCIYSPDAAVPIEDENRRQRFESKRDQDLSEIHDRMQQVEIERAYRILNALEKTTQELEDKAIPLIKQHLSEWKKKVRVVDIFLLALLSTLTLGLGISSGFLQGSIESLIQGNPILFGAGAGLFLILFLTGHFAARKHYAAKIAQKLSDHSDELIFLDHLDKAFLKNTTPSRIFTGNRVIGWNKKALRSVEELLEDSKELVQKLNDTFTDPSGKVVTRDK
ncbi:MAG: dynamin family protein [Gammaproteobacteria bacterium]|nr:MAG: dynamin family protein [Gammaproteobacteria bacterium]